MNVNYIIREGDTARILFNLQANGGNADITGQQSVTLYAESEEDPTAQVTLVATVTDEENGACYVTPAADTFLASKSPYVGYVEVVGSGGEEPTYPQHGVIVFDVLRKLSNA